MRLSISPLAAQDIEEIGDYIAQDNPVRAVSFMEELYQQCCQISEAPQIYRQRRELGESIRSCTYGKYLILFSSSRNQTRIQRVLYGSRDITLLL
ncbi:MULTISPECIES: type II toxin-antitoxin system RelE/ParE family toxin [Photorhabdus]|uniref:Toxin RelE n=1 Tax=Photorhabdus thracensis TaxID=230089 RepID=A0A0F7LNM7_9GAMM|nr:type II toxin-antitoxin system RelE/ParE family toxin [Photorhabdus thracensis]AKH63456.1 toxin RelE [Photorhabdus thracensis]MCC8420231.1 type II toxin-antitoxin system RelE/ParE family toxin [Photorhabdus thracensis]